MKIINYNLENNNVKPDDYIDKYTTSIRDRIREARIQLGLTQKEAAEKLHIKQSNLSRYESGETDLTIKIILQISVIFNIDLIWLINGNETNFENRVIPHDKLTIEEELEIIKLRLDKIEKNELCKLRSND